MNTSESVVLGVDYGTTNSSAAVFINGQVRVLEIDPTNTSPKTLKSSIFVATDGEISLGQAAIDQYIEKFEGIEIKTDFQITDDFMVVEKFGGNKEQDTIKERIIEEVELNLPGRFIMSPKRVLPNKFFHQTDIFGKIYTAEDLSALLLKQIKTRSEEILQREISAVNLGRPVHYSDNPDEDDLAIERITKAAQSVGFKDITFTYEPVGAAYNYSLQNKENKMGIVFDFGGGTFDTSVVEFFKNGEMKVIANEGVYVGGNKLNENLIYSKFMPYFGRDAKWGPSNVPIPLWITQNASRWETSVLMRKKENMELLEKIRRQTDDFDLIENLLYLIRYNLGLSLFLLAENLKIDLSNADPSDILPILWKRENIEIKERTSQEEFRKIVWNDISRIVQSMRNVLDKAELTYDDIDVVIKTGGSSRVFFVTELLQNIFPNAEIFEGDAFTDVTSGLAIGGYENVTLLDI
jgi:hypothetical chaperone protein